MNKLCEVQVSYRPNLKNGRHPVIQSSEAVAALKWELFDEDTIEYRESFVVIFLNRSARVLGINRLFSGGIAATVVDARLIVQQALLTNASAVIICHNHPSGNLTPSLNDDKITSDIAAGLRLFDIRLNDHIIMTADSHYSYSDSLRLNKLNIS